MMYTIQDLREGKCAVINDGTLDELKKVMRLAFPDDPGPILGTLRYYFPYKQGMNVKGGGNQDTDLPKQSVKDFLKNNFTIEDLAAGRCALLNDGTVEELRKILGAAFHSSVKWECDQVTSLHIQSVKDFLEPEFVLPEKYCVKNPNNNKESQLLYDYTNSLEAKGVVGKYPYSDGTYFHYPPYDIKLGNITCSFPNEGYTEITFEQFKKYVLNQKEEQKMNSRFPKKISQEEGRRIISNVCSEWKEKLLNKWSKDFVLHEFTIVSEYFYTEGRKAANNACNAEHLHNILDDIFGKDEPEYKYEDGELVLVRSSSEWLLRYTTGYVSPEGALECYQYQEEKGNGRTYWKIHKPAPGIVLPKG